MNLRIFRPLRIEDGILDGRNVPSPIDPGESYRIIGFIGEIPKILGHIWIPLGIEKLTSTRASGRKYKT